MAGSPVATSPTFLDALTESLSDAQSYNHSTEIAPAAVLWLDPEAEWEALIPRLRDVFPVLTLGRYDAEESCGPAAWIRCTVTRSPGMVGGGNTPIVYLPGWSIGKLRSVADYERADAPLAELQFWSSLWLQPDGREWSISAFLQRKDSGLGVSMQTGDLARAAMRQALIDLADQTVSSLRANAPLKVIDFQTLGGKFSDLEALIAGGETDFVEFKETGRYNMVPIPGTGGKGKPVERQPGADPSLEREIWKAVGGFLNSDHGGTLLLGVRDDGSIRGLDDDYSVTKPSRKDQGKRDAFVLFVMDLLVARFGKRVISCVSVIIPVVEDQDICRIDVRPAPWPAWAIEGKTGEEPIESFYLRSSNSTHKLPPSQASEYIRTRWP